MQNRIIILQLICNVILRLIRNADWLWAIFVLHVLTQLCGRYFSLISSILLFFIVLLLIVFSKFTQKLKKLTTTMIIIIILSLFSPLDICLQLSDKPKIAILPVVLSNGCNATVRKYKKHGLVENDDFIIYHWKTTTCPKRAIVIFVPYW
jgi:hypothetical protein